MGAAGKKEMHSAIRQDSHRAIRFRLRPEQTPWPRIPSEAVPSKADGCCRIPRLRSLSWV